jgi:LPXTG-motif cell wall-anchored protein
MTNTRKTRWRAGAGLVATLAASALALGVAAPSMAAPAAGLPDPAMDGQAQLVIHKHETPTPRGSVNNGLEQNVTSAAIQDVDFKIERITDVNLLTDAGWQKAAGMDVTAAMSAAKDAAQTGSTNAAGELTFSELPFGLYLVTETGGGPANLVRSAPFLVTLPLTHPTNLGSWLYTVNVYPKNDSVGIVKSVTDMDDVKVGDGVTWTLVSDVPDEPNLSTFTVTDVIDKFLTYEADTAQVTLVDAGGNAVGVTLTEGDDYTLVFDDQTGKLTLDFTDAGIAKLVDARSHRVVKVKLAFDTTVDEVGEIENTANLTVNDTTVESNTVVTKWGGILLEKVDARNAATTLPGARFKVYPTEADARADTNAIFGAEVFTTDENGRVVIDGLRYSDWENGATDSSPRLYWLAEVTAPTGYELLAAPVSFEVTSQADGSVVKTIENVKHNAGFTLPLTGGSGTTALMIAGLVILGSAVVLVTRSRRNAPAES